MALAQDADRITRDPGHRTFLDDEFERLGSRLVALDDWGDNTHEGELLKFLKDWVSKGERLKIAKRSRRGMLRKAREGKVILPPIPDYVSWPWKLWIAVAGTLLVIGGLAWISKLWVIVATGAAGAFFDLGLYALLVGSTGLGVRLAMGQEPAMCAFVVVGAPAAFFFSFALFTAIGYALVAAGRAVVGDALPAYLLEEGGIFIAAVVWLAVGFWLPEGVSLRGGARGAARATGDRIRAASAVSTRLYWGPAGVRSRPWAFPGPTISKRTSLAEPTIVAKNVSPLRCVLWP